MAPRTIITGPTSFVVGPVSDDDLNETVLEYALRTGQTLHDAILDITVQACDAERRRWNDVGKGSWHQTYQERLMMLRED
jgi:hypothetical protein